MSLKDETINKLTRAIERYPQFCEEEKKSWKDWVNLAPPEYAVFLLDLFENSPEDIRWLNQNIKEKEKILLARDEKAWQDLLDKEKVWLENFIKE